MSKISNSSKKRCKEYFGHSKGIGKDINTACSLIENNDIGVIISEFIYDYDNPLYNILLYLIRQNFHETVTKELIEFEYKLWIYKQDWNMKLNKSKKEEQKFIPYVKMGSFVTGIYRSVNTVPHSSESYLVRPFEIWRNYCYVIMIHLKTTTIIGVLN